VAAVSRPRVHVPRWEYVATATAVHLMGAAMAMTPDPATLCGRPVDGHWTRGDETASGLAATCRSCARLARSARRLP
jgi:hypothetical protein